MNTQSKKTSPQWPLWAGFILLALNMRLIFATVGPVLKNLQLGTTAILLVTTLPLLLLGFGQGAAPSLGAYLFVAKSASMETATRISAMAQTVGYLIAVTGPLVIGTIYQRTGDWSIPIWLLSALLVVELLVCLPAGRDVKV